MKATLLLLPLLAPSAALEHQLWDQGSLVQGSVLAQAPMQVREVPLVKRAKSRAYSQSVLRSAARASEGLAAAGALHSQVKDKLRVLTFGGPVMVPTPLDSLGIDLENVTGEDVMRLILAEIEFLRNDTYIAKVHTFLAADRAAVLNFTDVTSDLLEALKTASHQLSGDGALFEAIVAYFHQAAGTFQHMVSDITSLLLTELGLPSITKALVEVAVSGAVDGAISNFNASGSPNCTEFASFVQAVSAAHQFFQDSNLSKTMAEVFSNVTEGAAGIFTALAPDVVPTVTGIMKSTKNVTLDVIEALDGLLYQYTDMFTHLITHRLCW